MEKNFKHYNNIAGWLMFLIATVVYFLTLEPTASWWDCGEYIATAYKFQVGHPPGAPTFQLLGRLFSLFALGDTSKVAMMINGMSALSSAFTILFLFWSITILARKLLSRSRQLTSTDYWAVIAAGVIGSLTFTFSDSFWFSAVEGEVYAMSSMFTAVVFWAMLRWEAVADKTESWRWVILIAFLMGLSIGVHLLNLLAVPALAYIYYYKKYETTTKGWFITGVISVVILAFIMYFLIPMTVLLAQKFELFFVNSIGMPFNSGTVVYFLLLIGGIVFGLYYTQKNQKVLGNVLLLCLVFILIGYSTFFILVIRANANTPINENAPKDAISLLSYLNREQYGTRPLVKGPYFNSPQAPWEDGAPTRVKDVEKGKYVVTNENKSSIPAYDPKFETLFPRMFSSMKPEHISSYKSWADVKGTPKRAVAPDGTVSTVYKPTFGENLRFFFNYQIGHMYVRYFLWNFAGRQNDIEGHGGPSNGNWISGINAWDNARIGDQTNLPDALKNPAHNVFYMLPLLLGLFGMFFQITKDGKNAWIVGALFLMTGFAIIIYLNQTPYQPRERDYAYTGSFMAFCIWIGFGMLALYDFVVSRNLINKKVVLGVSFILTLGVPYLMAEQGWDDHNRAGKTAALDFASNYLKSCPPNALLFTNGDNDTFPLWYAQEVEGVRTDVRVVNYMLAGSYWYVQQMMNKVYESEKLPLTLSKKQYEKGINDLIPVIESPNITGTVTIDDAIRFLANDNNRQTFSNNERLSYLPVRNLRIPVDKAKVIASGLIPKDKEDLIVDYIDIKIKKSILQKNDLMLLDLIATNDWSRPICFANPNSMSSVMQIDRYCHQTGLVYRFLPYPAEGYMKRAGGIDVDTTFALVTEAFNWGNLEKEEVTVDRESSRNCYTQKNLFLRLTQQLAQQNDSARVKEVVKTYLKYIPNSKFPYGYYSIPIAVAAYSAGADEQGDMVAKDIFKNCSEKITYYNDNPTYFSNMIEDEVNTLFTLRSALQSCNRTVLVEELDVYITDFEAKINQPF